MRAFRAIPQPALILEALGVIVSGTALLSLRGYLDLPAPFDRAAWGIAMVFVGILLMLPAAVVMMWGMAKHLAPLLFTSPEKHHSSHDKDSHHDANH